MKQALTHAYALKKLPKKMNMQQQVPQNINEHLIIYLKTHDFDSSILHFMLSNFIQPWSSMHTTFQADLKRPYSTFKFISWYKSTHM